VLWCIAETVHKADLDDERFDVPEAHGIDVALRALSRVCDDEQIVARTGPLFDGLYEYYRRATLMGREPPHPRRLRRPRPHRRTGRTARRLNRYRPKCSSLPLK
jgi:hypothetical protein